MRIKTIGAVSFLIVLLGVAVFQALPFTRAEARSEYGNKQQYVIRTTGRSFIDLGQPGPSAGDRVVFDNPLFDRSNKYAVGSSRGECVQVGTAATIYHCLAVFTLPAGQITTQGIADFAGPPAPVAVTGGTGQYQSAHGQAIFTQTSPTTDKLDIELR